MMESSSPPHQQPRKPSWKVRLTTVSKVFGVGGSTDWQNPAEKAVATTRGESNNSQNGNKRRSSGEGGGGGRRDSERQRREGQQRRRNSLVLEPRGKSASVADGGWCVLDINGSDIVSYDTAITDSSSSWEDGDSVGVYVEKSDGVFFYTSSEEANEGGNMEVTDGLLDRFRGTKGSGGKSSGSPPAASGVGSRKSSFGSRLRPEATSKMTRPGSPQPLQRRPSGRGRSKLDSHDALVNGHAPPRSVSPTRSSRRKPSTSSNPPSRNESPNLSEQPRKTSSSAQDVHSGLHHAAKQSHHHHHQNGKNSRGGSPAGSPSPGSGESAFSKVRDTLKISKAKKKLKKKKGTAYSVDPVEINFPATNKYQDPFEAQPSFTDSMEVPSKAQSHSFQPVSIPHNKPEYCDHCGETAWGLYRQVLKCSICDFIVHRKCEARVNIDCSSKLERAVLQRDQLMEEHTAAEEEEDHEKEKEKEREKKGSEVGVPRVPDPSPESVLTVPSPSSSSSSSSSSSHHNNPQVLSEKAKLAKMIREYNRKTTPVNHIHIKSSHSQRDGPIEYVGFVRVHMCVQRPIHVSTAITRTSWYRLMRPVKERSEDAGLETAFYLPTDTNRLVHITNNTTTKELVSILLKKFCVTDNPKKFSLYEEYGGDCRRLFEEDNPLVISLEASVTNRNSKLILRDNTYSTIQWDAFTQPELNNFILILRREEDLYMDKLKDRFKQWKDCLSQVVKEKCKEEITRQTYLGSKTTPTTTTTLIDPRTKA